MTIGEKIKKRRTELKWTKAKLARKIGKSDEYITYIEDDVREPKDFDLKNIEKELNFNIETYGL